MGQPTGKLLLCTEGYISMAFATGAYSKRVRFIDFVSWFPTSCLNFFLYVPLLPHYQLTHKLLFSFATCTYGTGINIKKVDVDDETEPLTLPRWLFSWCAPGRRPANVCTPEILRKLTYWKCCTVRRFDTCQRRLACWSVLHASVSPLIIVITVSWYCWHNYNHAHACMQVIWNQLFIYT